MTNDLPNPPRSLLSAANGRDLESATEASAELGRWVLDHWPVASTGVEFGVARRRTTGRGR